MLILIVNIYFFCLLGFVSLALTSCPLDAPNIIILVGGPNVPEFSPEYYRLGASILTK